MLVFNSDAHFALNCSSSSYKLKVKSSEGNVRQDEPDSCWNIDVGILSSVSSSSQSFAVYSPLNINSAGVTTFTIVAVPGLQDKMLFHFSLSQMFGVW